MTVKTEKIPPNILGALSGCTVEGNVVRLTCGQLDRKDYLAVNKVLENLGGKWNRFKKGHVFDADPRDAIDGALLTGEFVSLAKMGFFETPAELVDKVIELARLARGHKVLEPSAGTGALADRAASVVGFGNVYCFEIILGNAETLRDKGFTVYVDDFLSAATPFFVDRVVMNPPFAKGADVRHVNHAYRYLNNNGVLVAIMSAGITFRQDAEFAKLRALIQERGFIDENPAGSFRCQGTDVNTVTVLIRK
jgi:predicted RNA methylase